MRPISIVHQDPCLTVFKHCSKDTVVICMGSPASCPLCDGELKDWMFSFRQIFAPWKTSESCPCTIVIRPTNGRFLQDYTGVEDLHIGIADSDGQVLHYDDNGIKRDTFWPECLPVWSQPDADLLTYGSGSIPDTQRCRWNNTLTLHTLSWRIDNHAYNEQVRNCFDFALGFVRALITETEPFGNKEMFTSEVILPKIQRLLRFLELYKKVCSTARSWIIQDTKDM
ncbi:MKRN2 opposite strand protein-like [Paramacrobiotus metropolitanus]|uniref:MKRN2 opposite strand protein-like n=1 Tax=Paramacrobiotus metropolitanus TaxID=2943436 RepID=UPI002446177B|nr:MKRN2 opposite strand protein-like [Paramacrobiotus metropolitanus]